MINDVDQTVQQLLELELGKPLPFVLSFAAPDKTFGAVNNKLTLNCYLYDIHEDRELREGPPAYRPTGDGTVERVYAPARIRLRYCITAWSPAALNTVPPPAMDEHRVLGQVLTALLRSEYHLPGQSPEMRMLDAIVQRCLAKDARGRYASASELASNLVPALARCEDIQRHIVGHATDVSTLATQKPDRT